MKNSIIRGTFILTVAGLISRLIGFYYRIFLSNAIGSEGMGLYQLVLPIVGLAFALCVGGIETAISKFVATSKNSSLTLISGIILSCSLSAFMSLIIYIYADYIAINIFLNSSCSYLIRIIAFAIPFICIENCINGYYYGLKKAAVPAISQLVEQTLRVVIVYLIIVYFIKIHRPVTAIIAAYGLVVGEMASCFFVCITLIFKKNFKFVIHGILKETKRIVSLALPLSANRILLTLLQGGEAILIPAQLILYGLNGSEALSVYGVLTGMAFPLILFPSTITNSVSVFLLPTVSKAQADNNSKTISYTISNSLKYSLIMGFFFTALFIVYGGRIGSLLFHNQSVGSFVTVLAWLCPFLYIATTLGSILNGLGKTTITCIQNTLGILIRIVFLILFVPHYGIVGYMWGLLLSQVYVCFAHIFYIIRKYKINFNPFDSIIIPILCILLSVGISLIIYFPLVTNQLLSEMVRLLIGGVVMTILYCGFYYINSPLKKKYKK